MPDFDAARQVDAHDEAELDLAIEDGMNRLSRKVILVPEEEKNGNGFSGGA
jgi:hypothetical protein